MEFILSESDAHTRVHQTNFKRIAGSLISNRNDFVIIEFPFEINTSHIHTIKCQ